MEIFLNFCTREEQSKPVSCLNMLPGRMINHLMFFAKLMFEGRTKAALQLLASQHNGGVLNLDDKADPGPMPILYGMFLNLNILLLNHFI